MFLIVIDAYSKWLEVKVMKSTTSTAIISSLWSIFTDSGYRQLLLLIMLETSLVQNFNIFYASMVSDTCFYPHTIQHLTDLLSEPFSHSSIQCQNYRRVLFKTKYHMCYFIATSFHTVQQLSLLQSCFKIADKVETKQQSKQQAYMNHNPTICWFEEGEAVYIKEFWCRSEVDHRICSIPYRQCFIWCETLQWSNESSSHWPYS